MSEIDVNGASRTSARAGTSSASCSATAAPSDSPKMMRLPGATPRAVLGDEPRLPIAQAELLRRHLEGAEWEIDQPFLEEHGHQHEAEDESREKDQQATPGWENAHALTLARHGLREQRLEGGVQRGLGPADLHVGKEV